MAGEYEQVGAVGSHIGAAMETAGHHVQSQLLDLFNSGLGDSLGGLLYLIAISGAVFITGVGGSYRMGRWLLIGPVLFWFLIAQRAPSDGALWQFGLREEGFDEVHEANRGILDGGGGGGAAGRVSYFFKVWNGIVSGIVQDLIQLAYLTQKDYDLDFVNKADRYGMAFRDNIKDAQLQGWINLTLINRCRQYLVLRWTAIDPYIPQDQREGAQAVLRDWPEDEKVFNRDDPDGRWYEDWLVMVGTAAGAGALLNERTFSCPELWRLNVILIREIEVIPWIEALVRFNIPRGLDENEVRQRLYSRFGMRLQGGEVQVREGDGEATMINELIARALFKQLGTLRPSLAQWDMNEHAQFIAGEAGRRMDQETARAIRILQKSDLYLHKGELIAGALTMPYIQGMVLYFLAMSFPFFALVTILPGRHTAMLTWMSLWVWAKLWDFGFAVVMLVDNILYALLPHGPQITNGDLQQPADVFAKVLEADPTYALHTYYNLLSCCLFAVPVVTGYLVHKGGSELVSAVSEGFKEFPQSFGNSMASYHRAMMVQENLGAIQQYIYNETVNAAWQSIVQDGELRGAVRKMLETSTNRGALDQFDALMKSGLSDAKKAEGVRDLMLKAGGKDKKWWDSVTQNGLQAADATLPVVEALKHIMDTGLGVEQQRYRQIAVAKLRANMAMAAYHASYSNFAVELAGDAVAMNWNSHDAGMDVPRQELLMLEQARAWKPYGVVLDAAYSQLMMLFLGAKKG